MDTLIDGLIKKMETSRQHLNTVLAQVTPQAEIYPTWKVKQIMDHIAGWDELVIAAIQAYSRSEPPPEMINQGINRYNSQSVEKRKDISLESSRKEYDEVRERLIETLRNVPETMLAQRFPAPWGGTCSIRGMVKIYISHEDEHAKQISEILQTKS